MAPPIATAEADVQGGLFAVMSLITHLDVAPRSVTVGGNGISITVADPAAVESLTVAYALEEAPTADGYRQWKGRTYDDIPVVVVLPPP